MRTTAELLAIIPQKLRKMTIASPSKDPAYNDKFIVYQLLYLFLIVLSYFIYVTTTSVKREMFCSKIVFGSTPTLLVSDIKSVSDYEFG